VHLLAGSDGPSTVFNVEGLLQQVRPRASIVFCKFVFTGFQSLFADLYMVFNFTRQISGVVIEYSNGTSWVSLPTAAMRPLSCSPGTSVFSDPSSAPLVHSCRCPFDRQIPAQPMCRSVRKWRCKYVTFVHLLLSLCGRALL
jgi:hypothetical protein